MGGSEVLGAGEVGGGQIPCMWEAGRVVARGVEERGTGTDEIGLGGWRGWGQVDHVHVRAGRVLHDEWREGARGRTGSA